MIRHGAVLWLLLALTRADGVPIWIDSDQIISVTYGGDGYCESRSMTTITTQAGHQCVKEGASTVVLAIQNAKMHGHVFDDAHQ